jgi:YHS domain-containing protein
MRTTLAVIPCIVLAALTASCGAAPTPSNVAAASQAAVKKAPGDARLGDRTTCPVSGEEFIVSDTSPKVDYEGQIYYFCCASCVKEFQANPAKYVGKARG